MYDPQFQRFSSAYDQVTLDVEPASGDPQISQHFIEDLRYWTADLDAARDADAVFVRTPEMDGHVEVAQSTDVPVQTITMPEHELRRCGLRTAPTQATFWVARPGHASQLERFYV